MVGRPREHASVRSDDTGRTLATRQVVALLTGLHIDTVRRRIPPVACDVETRSVLLDVDQVQRYLDLGLR